MIIKIDSLSLHVATMLSVFLHCMLRQGFLWKLILTCTYTDCDLVALTFLRGGFSHKNCLILQGSKWHLN